MKKFLVVVIALIVVGIVVGVLTKRGVYPVTLVNGEVITEHSWALSYNATQKYYESAIKTYGEPQIEFDRDNFNQDLRRVVLDTLIEQKLVSQGLTDILGAERAKQDVEEQLSQATTTARLSEEVQILYGLSLKEFSEVVLIPSAQKELLVVELKKQGVSFEAWIADKRLTADVQLFSSEFKWEEGELKDA